MKCRVCGGADSIAESSSAASIRADETFLIGTCKQCSVQTVMNVPDDLQAYYAESPMSGSLNSVHMAMKEILLSREGKRLQSHASDKTVFMDIGCGSGDFSRWMHRRGLPVAAIDAFAQRPVYLRDEQDVPYHQIHYNDYTLDMKPVEEGCVIMRHVIEHVKDPVQCLNRLREYGAKDFYIVVPNHGCLEARVFGKYYYFLDPPWHLWFFNRPSLRTLFASAGLDILQEGYDTIPNVCSSLYRWMSLKKWPERVRRMAQPQSVVNSLSAPVNLLFPRNVLWAYGRIK